MLGKAGKSFLVEFLASKQGVFQDLNLLICFIRQQVKDSELQETQDQGFITKVPFNFFFLLCLLSFFF